MYLTILTTSNLKYIIFVDLLKTSSEAGKWILTDIADHTQLGSPARLATKRRMIQSSGSQANMDDIVRRLEQQLEVSQIREEQLRIEKYQLRIEKDQLQRRAEKLQRLAEDSNRRSEDSNRRVEDSNRRAERAEERVQHTERSLAETRQSLRRSEQRYQISSTHWAVRRQEIQLTGPELGVGGWATVTVAKFR